MLLLIQEPFCPCVVGHRSDAPQTSHEDVVLVSWGEHANADPDPKTGMSGTLFHSSHQTMLMDVD